MYQAHPSRRLQEAFREKPYQGARPEDADFIFVGLDANYEPSIETKPALFNRVLEYHEDGVTFWKRHGVHHPFLLPGYGRGDGAHYHQNFAKIGLGSEHAHRISFVELVHVPTLGGSDLTAAKLDDAHIAGLNALIQRASKRNVFLSDKVIRLLRTNKSFGWLPKPIPKQVLPVLCRVGQTTVYQHLHFANFGVFSERMAKEATAIAALAAPSGQA